MQKTFLFLVLFILVSFRAMNGIVLDKAEAKKAFSFLNDIRANPGNYYKELQFSKDLTVNKTALIWNDTLAKVAEAKAYDMASRNYFGHTDPDGFGINHYISSSGYKLNAAWTKNKTENYFESIIAQVSGGEDAIRKLIIDKDIPSLGHRKHLLGLEKWNASLVDIGIGFARRDSGSTYTNYVSVIIAKHDW
jgi:uncharacterized protein YkwD